MSPRYAQPADCPASFDEREMAEAQIRPLVDALEEKCEELGIPLLVMLTQRRELTDKGETFGVSGTNSITAVYPTMGSVDLMVLATLGILMAEHNEISDSKEYFLQAAGAAFVAALESLTDQAEKQRTLTA